MRKGIFILLLPFCLGGQIAGMAQNYLEQGASLKGLRELSLRISAKTLADKELWEAALRSSIEPVLNKSGIKLVPDKETQNPPGTPVLSVSFDVRCPANNASCGYSTQFQLEQDVFLVRDGRIRVRAATWYNGYSGKLGDRLDFMAFSTRSTSYFEIMVDAAALANGFTQDYLRANSK